MTFAKWVYWIAGIWGLIVLVPQYFLEQQIGRDDPPAITHPEFFYGCLGVAIAWQVAFLIMSQDPQRYRPLMIATIIEKFSFAIAVPILFAAGRTSATVLGFSLVDLLLGGLFIESFRRTKPTSPQME